MSSYQYARFDDPSVCQDLETDPGNYQTIISFLHYLKSALAWGVVKPNQTCVTSLLAIANTQLPPLPPPDFDWDYVYIKGNKDLAQELLDTYFAPQMQVQVQVDADEEKVERKRQKNNLLPEVAQHLPPDLAGLLADYYSNCAVTTEDGKLCGLGQGEGFDFKDPAASDSSGVDNKMINCGHECSGDLCPQWLSSLLNNMPKVVNVAKIESEIYSGYTLSSEPPTVMPIDGVEIIILNPTAPGKPTWNYKLEIKTGSQATAEEIAGACRALEAPNESGVEMMLTLKLRNTIPFRLRHAMIGKILISFPDRDGGKYFTPHLRSWHIDFAGNFYASVNLPSHPRSRTNN